MKGNKQYWLDLINEMTLEELEDLNKHGNHPMFSVLEITQRFLALIKEKRAKVLSEKLMISQEKVREISKTDKILSIHKNRNGKFPNYKPYNNPLDTTTQYYTVGHTTYRNSR